MESYLDFQITDDLKKDIQDYFFKYNRKDTGMSAKRNVIWNSEVIEC